VTRRRIPPPPLGRVELLQQLNALAVTVDTSSATSAFDTTAAAATAATAATDAAIAVKKMCRPATSQGFTRICSQPNAHFSTARPSY
jgi:hypothetical protein